jgi:hypothetical protein
MRELSGRGQVRSARQADGAAAGRRLQQRAGRAARRERPVTVMLAR